MSAGDNFRHVREEDCDRPSINWRWVSRRSRPSGLVKDFGDTRAVDGVSLAVPAGTIYGMLGPNGAGKTTTLRMLLGIIDPSSGTRRLLGHDRPLEAARQVGYLPEERGLYPAMSAARSDRLHGRASRPADRAKAAAAPTQLLAEHGLSDWAKKPIRTLSKGMAQTVQLLGTIIHARA